MNEHEETSSQQAFKQMHLADGTWKSVCLRCYGTVARTAQEAELAAPEAEHECVPFVGL